MVRRGSSVRIRSAASAGDVRPECEHVFVHVVKRGYRYRLDPTASQRASLVRFAGARRFAYNWALERWLDHHDATGATISRRELSRRLTVLKSEPGYEWMRDIDSQLLQQALVDLRRAFRNFFEGRSGFPRFSSRKATQRFRIPQRVVLRGNRVLVPKVGWVRLRLSRELPGPTRSATFSRDDSGSWYVTLVTEVPAVPKATGEPRRPIGVDLGIINFAVLSDGRRVPPASNLPGAERRVRRAHRELARKRSGSRRRAQARTKVARQHRRLARRRSDFLHKLSSALIAEHDVVCIEDLGLRGMARTKLSRVVSNAGFGEFRRQLVYKAEVAGVRLVVVDRFFPSSRRCGACGARNADLRLDDRCWTCPCGAVHDRDVNAARNILEEGLRQIVAVGLTDTQSARGVHVSLPTEAVDDEAGTSPAVDEEANMEVLYRRPADVAPQTLLAGDG